MDNTFGYYGQEGDLLHIREMSVILKVEGRLIIETFDKEYGIRNPGSSETGQYWGTYDAETDRFSGQSLYDRRQWQRMLELAGMRLLKVFSADDYSLQYAEYLSGHKYIIIVGLKLSSIAAARRGTTIPKE